MERNDIPFPQADDFEKVISLINIPDESKLSDKKYISFVLENVTDRQVMYYLSAAISQSNNMAISGTLINSKNFVLTTEPLYFCLHPFVFLAILLCAK